MYQKFCWASGKLDAKNLPTKPEHLKVVDLEFTYYQKAFLKAQSSQTMSTPVEA